MPKALFYIRGILWEVLVYLSHPYTIIMSIIEVIILADKGKGPTALLRGLWGNPIGLLMCMYIIPHIKSV